MNNLGLKKGILVNFIAKYSNVFAQLIITSILARLLSPSDYGIISVIMIFIVFFNLLGDMGIGPAIIQNKDLQEDDISNIFIFTIFISIVLGIAFVFFSYFIAYIYNDKVYILLGRILCFSIIFNILLIVPNSILLKNKKFKIIGISNLITNLIAGSITIILAFKGFKYYSLVINSIIQAFFNFLIFFYLSKIKINLSRFNIKSIQKIGKFSTYQFLFNFLNYFSRNADNILIGKFLGVNQLAYYDKSYRLMLYPIQNLTFVITPVLQPILSDYQDDKDIILTYYLKIVKLLGLMGVFFSVFCFFTAKEIILIMYGQQWIGSISSFRYLAISIGIQMMLSSSGSIFQSTGSADKLFVSGVFVSIITVSCIVIGINFSDINTVSLGILIAYILNFIQTNNILIKRVFNKNMYYFYKNLDFIIPIVLIMIISYKVFNIELDNYIYSFIYKFFIGLASYVIGLILTKEYKFIKKILINKF